MKQHPILTNYCITKDGRVWSSKRKIYRKPRKDKDGYLRINIYHDGKLSDYKIHTLVLETYVGPKPEGCLACHKNDIKIDNRPDNLYWGTPNSNMKDMYRNGYPATRGEDVWCSKLNKFQVRVIKRLLEFGLMKQCEIAAIFGVCHQTIHCIKYRKTWKHL